ncbi:MAG: TIGR02281 family clan AA aspartic protease [Gammaproteobacteria bacterium]|nr:TIGR02281 family clan AA aspartic protease [Gammaproteobacteria bacterium]
MQSETKELGAIFTWLGWIAGITLLVLLFNKILGNEGDYDSSIQNSNGLQTVEIKIKQNRQGHYLLRAQVNKKPVLFLIDSGATVTSIPMNLAKKLNLDKGMPFSVQTANGKATAYQTIIKELKLGSITLKNVRASLNPGMNGHEALLGMNVLKNFELVQRDKTLIIRQY